MALSWMQRSRWVVRCVEDAVESASNDRRWLYDIFRDGFNGFANMTDEELQQAYEGAGLHEMYDD